MMKKNRPQFIIRAAQENDLSSCLALDHSSASNYVWQVEVSQNSERSSYTFRTARLPRPVTLSYPRTAKDILASWQYHVCFLVAASETQIYGYLNMRVGQAPNVSWVSDLVVGRAWRQHHVGSALLQQARQWAYDHHFHRMMIETQTKNHPAIAFCEHHGFTFCGFNDRYYANQDIALFFSRSVR